MSDGENNSVRDHMPCDIGRARGVVAPWKQPLSEGHMVRSECDDEVNTMCPKAMWMPRNSAASPWADSPLQIMSPLTWRSAAS